MNTSLRNLGYNIDLGDNIYLVYQKPEIFSKYLAVYHGQKYAHYYFRSSPDTILDKANYLDSGYFILRDKTIIGGLFIKTDYMSDLFVVSPYTDYEKIADKILNYLKRISKNERIILQEVVESYVPFYESQGCIINSEGFWMIRPTEAINPIALSNYEARSIVERDKDEIGYLIQVTYKSTPSIKDVGSKEIYIKSVENFLKNTEDNEVLYNSSKVVMSKITKEIVGVCLHMEFEGFPLITHLVVRPDHQCKGIGRYLLTHSINYTSTAYTAIRLYVYKNSPAIKLYEDLGFVKNGMLTDMYLEVKNRN